MLPSWKGRPKHHIATNVGRYLQSGSLKESKVLISGNTWSGPYRLETGTLAVRLDISQTAAERRLHVRYKFDAAKKKQRMLEFTLS